MQSKSYFSKLPSLLAEKSLEIPSIGKNAQVTHLRSGISNIAFKVQNDRGTYLLKFAVAPASKPSVYIQADYEQKLALKLHNFSITPRHLGFGKVILSGRVFPYSIQEFIEGEMPNYKSDLPKIAKTLFALHSKTKNQSSICDYKVLHPKEYLAKKSIYYSPKIQKNKLLSNFQKKADLHLIQSESNANYLSLIHNDLTSENMLISKSKAYLIDWGWAMYSSAALDLCNLLSPFTTSWTSQYFLSAKQSEEFLDSYFSLFPRRDAKIIATEANSYWPSYNSMLANWILCDFLPNHPIKSKSYFSSKSFLNLAFEKIDSHQRIFSKFT